MRYWRALSRKKVDLWEFSPLFRQKPFGDENKWISWTSTRFSDFLSIVVESEDDVEWENQFG
jgi:hypothetical protein